VHDTLGASGLSEIARQKIIESLAQGRDRMVNAGRPYDPVLPWLPNAEAQQASGNPFSGIIALENPRVHAEVVVADALTDVTPCFVCPADVHVRRTAREMVDCVRSLLSKSREVLLIDPHFGCLDPRFYAVLLEVVQQLPAGLMRLEYHLARKSLILDEVEYSRRLERHLSPKLRKGLKIEFFAWEQRVGGEMLHDRFIVTELGGVNFSVGLDEGAPGQTTKVSRLSKLTHQKVWHDYSNGTAAFDLRLASTVIGTA
jgi:hypothetical protein